MLSPISRFIGPAKLTETLELPVEKAVDELRQKDDLLIIQGRQALMGEMISTIAHHWRQPLNTLGLTAQALQVNHNGLSLFISKIIVEKHMNGTLTVRNVGSGAEFTVEI